MDPGAEWILRGGSPGCGGTQWVIVSRQEGKGAAVDVLNGRTRDAERVQLISAYVAPLCTL